MYNWKGGILDGRDQSDELFQILSQPPKYEYGGITWVSPSVAEEARQFQVDALNLEREIMLRIMSRHPKTKKYVTSVYRQKVVEALLGGGKFQLFDINPQTRQIKSMQVVDLPACQDLLKTNETIEGAGTKTLCARK